MATPLFWKIFFRRITSKRIFLKKILDFWENLCYNTVVPKERRNKNVGKERTSD